MFKTLRKELEVGPALFGLWLALGGILLGGCAWALVGKVLIPFDPYTVISYSSLPPQGCAGSPIRLDTERILERPLFGAVEATITRTYWQSLDGSQVTPTQTFTSPEGYVFTYGYGTFPSTAVRVAPPAGNRWRLVSRITAIGHVLGLPRQAEDNFVSKQIFVSLPENDPRCLKG